MTTTKTRILIGSGTLTWCSSERRSDRYGSVVLQSGNSLGDTISDKAVLTGNYPVADHGSLYAVIIKTRASTHIGDIARGVFPVTPEVGSQFKLGTGTFFVEPVWEKQDLAFGVIPDDDREDNWLDIHALYQCHEQDVELYFIPEK